jgi:hypothetical protein
MHNLQKMGFHLEVLERQGGDVATVGQIICLLLAVRQVHLPRWVQKLYNKVFAFLDRKSYTQCMPLNYGLVGVKQPVPASGGSPHPMAA